MAALAAMVCAVSVSTAQAATITCAGGNGERCTAYAAKGIKKVYVATKVAGSTLVLVQKTYGGCPKSAKVGWDPKYRPTVKSVVPC